MCPALRQETHALVRHCLADEAAPVWRMIDASSALREYEGSMRLRHAETLAAALAAEPGAPRGAAACRALARFVVDAFALAREADDPRAAVDEIFRMVEAAWEAAGAGVPVRPAT